MTFPRLQRGGEAKRGDIKMKLKRKGLFSTVFRKRVRSEDGYISELNGICIAF